MYFIEIGNNYYNVADIILLQIITNNKKENAEIHIRNILKPFVEYNINSNKIKEQINKINILQNKYLDIQNFPELLAYLPPNFGAKYKIIDKENGQEINLN